MRYFGIKTPATENEPSYIWWIADGKHEAWMAFFQYPNKDGKRIMYRLCIADAIKAYEGIGYKCVEVELKEIESKEEQKENEE
jgi:hypothetical protein